jgi:hypothetical protein
MASTVRCLRTDRGSLQQSDHTDQLALWHFRDNLDLAICPGSVKRAAEGVRGWSHSPAEARAGPCGPPFRHHTVEPDKPLIGQPPERDVIGRHAAGQKRAAVPGELDAHP